ncbi:bifunctional DNA primase/polymerase [Streptomyces sp. ASQP_92]|uniref:bifunctional DNA primase/polymerase n=1 Tax=Streptomyces sp. ASQP_92 TaxID=2979116 RepID=UPI0021C10E98|nr:bifunctional DNA primase/polymerase [Streptomyces sp. ASQP_92]MCT9090457.1 bifunctional DNA primase/polymerase [Streptomyces sp. ASQP_92]
MTQPTLNPRECNLALLAWALETARRGWPVFPLRPGDKRPAGHAERSCPGTGRCAGGHRKPEQRATTDPDLITAAWTTQPYNIGIATGPAGLLVVDLDMLKAEEQEGAPGGAESLLALCERAGQTLPATYQVRTPSGGHHLYFTAPEGVRLGCSVNRLGRHVDTRGWGGYVVAPSSATAHGDYTVTDESPVAPLPGWLADELRERAKPGPHTVMTQVCDGTKAAQTALERECAVIRAAGDHSRNSTLHKSACKVARFVAWGNISRATVEEAIQAAGESTGLPAAECATTIRSAMDWILTHATPREAA